MTHKHDTHFKHNQNHTSKATKTKVFIDDLALVLYIKAAVKYRTKSGQIAYYRRDTNHTIIIIIIQLSVCEAGL